MILRGTPTGGTGFGKWEDEMNTDTARETAVVELGNGSVFRLLTLMTHYRQPLNFSAARMDEARRILNRWGRAAIPCDDGPPLEILVAFGEDFNTPKMVAAMHVYRKTDGRKLFAAMRFLGIFEGGTCMPDEVKTIPSEHMGLAQPGPQTAGVAQ